MSSKNYGLRREFAPEKDPENPVMFMDITLGGIDIGRVLIELYEHVCPKTVENFRQLCTGEFIYEGKPTGYKGTLFHQINKDSCIIGGDVTKRNGSGRQISIYGPFFPDETFQLKHDEPGIISMVNTGPDTNDSQFMFITCSSPSLDGKQVAFGKVLGESSLNVLYKIEQVSTNEMNKKPLIDVRINECGQM